MPAFTAYSPFETLTFFQSIARYGADFGAFENISAVLSANDLVRQGSSYDASRFTPAALQDLYEQLLTVEGESVPTKVNGDALTETPNPRKRKLSDSTLPNGDASVEGKVPGLVEKLYARFKEEAIKEIERDEAEYVALQDEIKQLQGQVDLLQQAAEQASKPAAAQITSQTSLQTEASRSVVATATEFKATEPGQTAVAKPEAFKPVSPKQVQRDPRATVTGGYASPQLPILPSQHSPVAGSSGRASVEASRQSQPPSQPHSSPGAFHRTLPPPSPQRPSYGPIPAQHGYAPGPQGHPPPPFPVPGMPQVARQPEYANQKRSSASSTPNRGSPMPIQHHPQYPGYPPYQPPPWPVQMPPHYPYPTHSPHPQQQFYVQSPGGRHGPPYQTPHQSPYQQYPQTAPVHYPGHHPPMWYPPPGPHYGHPSSAHATPVPRQLPRKTNLRVSGSATPWKKKAESSTGLRPPSPARPVREVSPLSDTEQPTPQPKTEASKHSDEMDIDKDEPAEIKSAPKASRRGRAASITPIRSMQSRSQSIASFDSDAAAERSNVSRRAQRIKVEHPSTPVPPASDAGQGQRLSGRRGRPRNETLSQAPELLRTGTVTKRKRSLGGEALVDSPLPSPSHKMRRTQTHDPSLVVVSKSFAKTAHLLLSEITSHKLGGIFAKPLSDRDAPGYSDLVLRPQDLKSIKSAVSKGNRAVVTAIDALDSEKAGDDSTPTKDEARPRSRSAEGPIGNGLYLVKKTEDLVQPRGIVNSSQMEMELVRTFANAVMFNPLQSTERGFGRSLRTRKNGGDVLPADDNEAEASDDGSSAEEGGIISDAREMFEDTMQLVRKWREVEGERMGADIAGTSLSVSAGRHGSVSVSLRQSSVSSALNDDDANGNDAVNHNADVDNALVAGRKRRKIAVE